MALDQLYNNNERSDGSGPPPKPLNKPLSATVFTPSDTHDPLSQ